MDTEERMNRGDGAGRHLRFLLVAALALLTVAVYARVGGFDFVNLDDPLYVYQNEQVKEGLGWAGIAWAFSTFHASNWHPLTWLSHMADVELFGVNAGAHHLVNLLLHLANTLLLFALLVTTTRAFYRALFVAALFALHPLHVESVAWVSERKDLLSALFFMLTLLAYCRYVKHRTTAGYLLVAALFALGLMAKPMLVTLPFVLLLLDFWPLARLEGVTAEADSRGKWKRLRPLLLEKIPLLLLSTLSCMVTFVAQKRGDAIAGSSESLLLQDFGNAFQAYFGYIRKMVWPADLAVQYPFVPEGVTFAKAGGSFLFIAAVTVLSFRLARRFPYLLAGWLWYLGMMVPVVGFLRVGEQSMADRYTYLPLIGLFMMVVWGCSDGAAMGRIPKKAARLGGAALLCFLTAITVMAVGYWRDTQTLFSRAIEVTDRNWIAHNNLANYLQEKGAYLEALHHVEEALKISPNTSSYFNLGTILGCLGQIEKSTHAHVMAVRIDPNNMRSHFELGLNYAILGQIGLAEKERDILRKDYPELAERLEYYLRRYRGRGL